MDDSALLQGLRTQDPQAVQHLSDAFLPTVWRFVYGRVNGDQHLAEDIVSETVLALIRAVSDKDLDIRNPGAWLRSVASNKVTDHFRAAARVQHLIDEAKKTSPLADEEDAVKQQERDERRAEIRSVMDELPEQHRLALEWKYVDKLSVREIAERMGTTEKAVESVLFRARREFRQRVVMVDQETERSIESSSIINGERPASNGARIQNNGNDVRADNNGKGSFKSGETSADAGATAAADSTDQDASAGNSQEVAQS